MMARSTGWNNLFEVACRLSLLSLILWLPASAMAQRSGYSIEYLDAWPINSQTKYIRINIAPIGGPAAEDIDFYVVAQDSGYNIGTTVSTMIPIRKGDTSATGELYVPSYNGQNFSLHTEIDGNLRIDRGDFAQRDYYDYNGGTNTKHGSTPSFLIASSDVVSDETVRFTAMNRNVSANTPMFTPIATSDDFLPLEDMAQWYAANNNINSNRKFMTVQGFTSPLSATMSLESLPSMWFGYEGLGMVMITHDDLMLLKKKHPGKLLAIERWIAASGRLVVLNCGEDLSKSISAMQALGDSNAEFRNDRRCKFLTKSPDPSKIDYARDIAPSLNAQVRYGNPFQYRSVQTEVEDYDVSKIISIGNGKLQESLDSGAAADLIAIDFERGKVICVSDSASDWSQDKVDRWGALGLFLNELHSFKDDKHVMLNAYPLRRFGFPEFAEPPRYVFEFTILAYLLFVGPLAFFVLKQMHKLNLMFIVVPVISAAFCTTILAYAIFAEGFDTRVNVFTFTKLNQQTGRQTTSSIAHVYSGMTPAAYRMEGATYGYVNIPSGGRTQRISWSNNAEEVSGGEIRPRTNHQLFTRCSNETQDRLSFLVSGNGEETSATVRNNFKVPVVGVAFGGRGCSSSEAWLCERIEPGQSAKAKKLDLSEACQVLRELVRERSQTTAYAGENTYHSNNSRRRNYGTPIGDIENSEAADMLDAHWHMRKSDLTRVIQNGNGFLAITESSTNYKMPVPNAKVESQIHVVHGVR